MIWTSIFHLGLLLYPQNCFLLRVTIIGMRHYPVTLTVVMGIRMQLWRWDHELVLPLVFCPKHYLGPTNVKCFAYWGNMSRAISLNHWSWISARLKPSKTRFGSLIQRWILYSKNVTSDVRVWYGSQIENLKENLKAERKHGLLMKFANMFLRSAYQTRLQEATRKMEECEGKLGAIRGIVAI